MNLEDRIASGAFTLIAEIGVNITISLGSVASAYGGGKAHVQRSERSWRSCGEISDVQAESLASRHSPSYWDTSEESSTSQYELFKRYDSFGEREYRELSVYCDSIGIGFCSTPFDFESADYLEP